MAEEEYTGNFFFYSNYMFKAFRSTRNCGTVLIYITGLDGSLFSDNLSKNLYNFCKLMNMTYVQPIFRSHPNYGLYTLDDDTEELFELIKLFKSNKIIFVGSSTGCQDIIHLFKKYNVYTENILFSVLQGPVSDREYEVEINKEEVETTLNNLNNIHSDHYFIYNNVLFKKQRWLDLFNKNGHDDLFSSDLADEHFKNLNPKNIKFYFILCLNDQFMVKGNKSKLQLVPNSIVHEIENADHFLSANPDMRKFNKLLQSFMSRARK